MQGLVRATALAFAPLSLEQAAVVKAYFREIVAVGFEAGLLWKGMIQYPSGEISAGLEDVVNYCWDKVRAPCCATSLIISYTDSAILQSQIIGMAVARGVGHKYSLLMSKRAVLSSLRSSSALFCASLRKITLRPPDLSIPMSCSRFYREKF